MSNAFSPKTSEYGNSSGFTSVRAPSFINTPAQNAANIANQQFAGTAPESYVNSQSRNLAGQTLRGDFLTPQSNPFLAQVGQNIGDSVFNQVSQRYAGAGRNVGGADAQGQFRSDLTNQLAPMYADNYARERGIQANTMSTASQFDPTNQLIQRLGPLANLAGRDITTESSNSGVTRERGSPFDIFASLFG